MTIWIDQLNHSVTGALFHLENPPYYLKNLRVNFWKTNNVTII